MREGYILAGSLGWLLAISGCATIQPADHLVPPAAAYNSTAEAVAYAHIVSKNYSDVARKLSQIRWWTGQAAILLGTGAAAAATFDAHKDLIAGFALGSAATFAELAFLQPLEKAAVYDQAMLQIQCAVEDATALRATDPNTRRSLVDEVSGRLQAVRAQRQTLRRGREEARAGLDPQSNHERATHRLTLLVLINDELRQLDAAIDLAEKAIQLADQLRALEEVSPTRLVNQVQRVQTWVAAAFRNLDQALQLKELSKIESPDGRHDLAKDAAQTRRDAQEKPETTESAVRSLFARLIQDSDGINVNQFFGDLPNAKADQAELLKATQELSVHIERTTQAVVASSCTGT